MIINKAVAINPVEPSPLSFRAPMGMETKLNVIFYSQNGAPYSSDLAAQLQLTGRTSARTSSYFMPATDIVNGKARATIPADALNDSNGYRLRIVGTLNGEPALLALGSVMPIASAGFEAVPEDIIDTVDIVLTRGRIAEIGVKLWDDEDKTNPYELDTTTISSNVYAARGGVVLVPFVVTPVSANEVVLTLTIEEVDALPATCWWTLVASNANGAHTLCEGTITVKDAPVG
jgi:hypothetical protein